MNVEKLRSEVLRLLETSSISEKHKLKVRVSLPSLDGPALQRIYDLLAAERGQLDLIDQKEKLLDLKYEMLADKYKQLKINV